MSPLRCIVLTLMMFGLMGCDPNNQQLPSLAFAPNLSGSQSTGSSGNAGEPELCLTPLSKKAWHDRRQSLNASEAELEKRSAEVGAREVLLPLTARGNILGSGFQTIASAAGLAKPICGNWCGAARRYRGDDPPAVDELDSACRKHEQCTLSKRLGLSQKGPSCVCDQELADEILRGRNLVSLSDSEKRVVMYLQGQPCGGGCKRIENVQVCGR